MNTVGITGGFFGPYYMGLAKDYTGSYQRGFLGLALACSFSLFLLTRLARKSKQLLAPSGAHIRVHSSSKSGGKIVGFENMENKPVA